MVVSISWRYVKYLLNTFKSGNSAVRQILDLNTITVIRKLSPYNFIISTIDLSLFVF